MTWSSADIPDLTGRSIIVTGANSGIGLEAATSLAAHGAAVTLAVRDVDRGSAAADQIRAASPEAQVEVARLDLADLASVREFAAAWTAAHPDGLDVLVNNAGVMAIPRRETADGFEMQFGTNHLGHFALTGLLVGSLRPAGRVVTVSSGAHRFGRMDFDDLQSASPTRSGGSTGRASWPTSCSPSSCTAGPRPRARTCAASRCTQGTQRPTCSRWARRCRAAGWGR